MQTFNVDSQQEIKLSDAKNVTGSETLTLLKITSKTYFNSNGNFLKYQALKIERINFSMTLKHNLWRVLPFEQINFLKK